MKILLCFTLLGAMLPGSVVFGQTLRQMPEQTQPGYIKPPMLFKLSPGKTLSPGKPYSPRKPYLPGKPYKDQLFARAGDSVRIMSPDRMPCLVSDLSRMEPMPVQQSRNRESMPNGVGRKKQRAM